MAYAGPCILEKKLVKNFDFSLLGILLNSAIHIPLMHYFFPFSAQCETVQETDSSITKTKYKCDLCEYISKEPTDVIWHHLECHFEST